MTSTPTPDSTASTDTRMAHFLEGLRMFHENLTCAICLETLRDPCRTKCAHLFCQFCLGKAFTDAARIRCPLCNAPGVTKRSLNTDFLGKEKVLEFNKLLDVLDRSERGRIQKATFRNVLKLTPRNVSLTPIIEVDRAAGKSQKDSKEAASVSISEMLPTTSTPVTTFHGGSASRRLKTSNVKGGSAFIPPRSSNPSVTLPPNELFKLNCSPLSKAITSKKSAARESLDDSVKAATNPASVNTSKSKPSPVNCETPTASTSRRISFQLKGRIAVPRRERKPIPFIQLGRLAKDYWAVKERQEVSYPSLREIVSRKVAPLADQPPPSRSDAPKIEDKQSLPFAATEVQMPTSQSRVEGLNGAKGRLSKRRKADDAECPNKKPLLSQERKNPVLDENQQRVGLCQVRFSPQKARASPASAPNRLSPRKGEKEKNAGKEAASSWKGCADDDASSADDSEIDLSTQEIVRRLDEAQKILDDESEPSSNEGKKSQGKDDKDDAGSDDDDEDYLEGTPQPLPPARSLRLARSFQQAEPTARVNSARRLNYERP